MGTGFTIGAVLMAFALTWDLAVAFAFPFRETLNPDVYWVARRLFLIPMYCAIAVAYPMIAITAVRFSTRESAKIASIRGALFLAASLMLLLAAPLAADLLHWSIRHVNWQFKPLNGGGRLHFLAVLEALLWKELWLLPLTVLSAFTGALMLAIGLPRLALVHWKTSVSIQADNAE